MSRHYLPRLAEVYGQLYELFCGPFMDPDSADRYIDNQIAECNLDVNDKPTWIAYGRFFGVYVLHEGERT